MKAILFFDGECNLCNASVNFVIRRNQQAKFQFASLQGATAQSLLSNELRVNMTSFVLYTEDGQLILTKSDGALRVLLELGWPWSLFYVFKVLPLFFRNFVYDLVARHRFQIFGRRETCRIPEEHEKAYFLD